MTEITYIDDDLARQELRPSVSQFILHWGDMGSQWGVNRSVAQIHALLYLSAKPLTAEDIAEKLSIARSNVSNSLKELLGWRLIRREPIMGDRRDHYVAETDLWEMVSRIAAGRKEREIDPALKALQSCVEKSQEDEFVHPVAAERLVEMLEFMQKVDRWYAQMIKVPTSKIMKLMAMGSKVVNFLK